MIGNGGGGSGTEGIHMIYTIDTKILKIFVPLRVTASKCVQASGYDIISVRVSAFAYNNNCNMTGTFISIFPNQFKEPQG